MLNKYTFSNNQAVVDQPSIWKIGNGKVSITHASGTNTVNIPSSGYLTVKVGNIFSIQEEDISPIEAVEIENPNSENNSGNNSGSDSGNNSGNNSGSDSGNENGNTGNESGNNSGNEGGNSGNEGGNSGGGTTPVVPSGNTCYVEQTGGSGITYVIHNQTEVEARLSGGVVLNLSKNPSDWENSTQAYAHMHAPTIGSSYAYNDIIIPVGGTYTSSAVTTITGIYQPSTNFLDGTWYFMNTDSPRNKYIHSIFVYSRIWNNNDNESQGSNHMYWAANPPQNAKLQNGITIHIFLTNVNPEATLQDASTGSGQSGHYVILDYQQTGLV